MNEQEYRIDLEAFEEWARNRYYPHGQGILDKLQLTSDMRFTFSRGYSVSGTPLANYEWLVDVRTPSIHGVLREVPRRFFKRIASAFE